MILLSCLATWCGGLTGKQDTNPSTVAKDLVLKRAASPCHPHQASPISSPAGRLAPAGVGTHAILLPGTPFHRL